MNRRREMKKNLVIICAIIAMVAGTPNRAQALILDAPTLASKISEWVGKLTDATTKISQQVSQVKQMSSQGFNKEELFGIAQEYATDYGKDLLQVRMQKIVEGTKKKNRDKIETEKETYVTTKNAYYDEKIGIMDESIQETKTAKAEKQSERTQKLAEVNQKKSYYESVKGNIAEEPKAFDEYMKAEMEYEELDAVCNELDELLSTLEEQKKVLEEEKAKVGTSDDPDYVLFEKRLEEMDSEIEEADGEGGKEEIVSKSGGSDVEWDDEDIVEDFSPTEKDYTDFLERYFYNPEDLSSAGADARVSHQTKIDAVTRERRFLLVNSAAHLLQVSATLRREIPVRSEIIDKMFQNTPQATGELEAISSYSATRIESMKALLMYAKLQSARLQYMAAKKLLSVDAIKVPNGSYADFNLDKYILTKEDVDKAIEEANTANSAVTDVEDSYEVNAGDYQWLENK